MTHEVNFTQTHQDLSTCFAQGPVKNIRAKNPFWSRYTIDQGDSTSQKVGKYALRFFSVIMPVIPMVFFIGGYVFEKNSRVQADKQKQLESTKQAMTSRLTKGSIAVESESTKTSVKASIETDVEKVDRVASTIAFASDGTHDTNKERIIHLLGKNSNHEVDALFAKTIAPSFESFTPKDRKLSVLGQTNALKKPEEEERNVTINEDKSTVTIQYHVKLGYRRTDTERATEKFEVINETTKEVKVIKLFNETATVAQGVATVVFDFENQEVRCGFKGSANDLDRQVQREPIEVGKWVEEELLDKKGRTKLDKNGRPKLTLQSKSIEEKFSSRKL